MPVDWIDDPDSRVDIIATATADLKGIARMRRGFAKHSIPVGHVAEQLGIDRVTPSQGIMRQVAKFGAIGIVSTLARAFWSS